MRDAYFSQWDAINSKSRWRANFPHYRREFFGKFALIGDDKNGVPGAVRGRGWRLKIEVVDLTFSKYGDEDGVAKSLERSRKPEKVHYSLS